MTKSFVKSNKINIFKLNCSLIESKNLIKKRDLVKSKDSIKVKHLVKVKDDVKALNEIILIIIRKINYMIRSYSTYDLYVL